MQAEWVATAQQLPGFSKFTDFRCLQNWFKTRYVKNRWMLKTLNGLIVLKKSVLQGDYKTVITKSRITSDVLFPSWPNFIHIMTRLCAQHPPTFKSLAQRFGLLLALQGVLQMSPPPPPLQAHFEVSRFTINVVGLRFRLFTVQWAVNLWTQLQINEWTGLSRHWNRCLNSTERLE